MSIKLMAERLNPNTPVDQLSYKEQIVLFVLMVYGRGWSDCSIRYSNGIYWNRVGEAAMRRVAIDAVKAIKEQSTAEFNDFCRNTGIEITLSMLISNNYEWSENTPYTERYDIQAALQLFSTKNINKPEGIKRMTHISDDAKKWLIWVGVSVAVIALLLIPCMSNTVKPDAGYEAVLVDKPIFGSGGIRKDVVTTGRKYTWFTTDAIYVNMLPQVVTVKFDDLASSDRFLLDFTAQVRVRFTDSYSLVTTVGNPDGAWDRTLDPFFRALVRDNVKKYKMENLMTDDKSAGRIDTDITAAIETYILAKKIPVQILDITLGQAKPNAEIVNQMNATSAELQRKGQMSARADAELQRKVAEKNRAAADNEYRNQLGYTPEQYLSLRKAEIQADACKAAAGGCVYYNGTVPIVTSSK